MSRSVLTWVPPVVPVVRYRGAGAMAYVLCRIRTPTGERVRLTWADMRLSAWRPSVPLALDPFGDLVQVQIDLERAQDGSNASIS